MKMRSLWLSIILLCPALAGATSVMQPYRATYHVQWHGMTIGQATRALKLDSDGHYQFRMISESSLPLYAVNTDEFSLGEWHDGDPVPSHYEYRYQNGGKSGADVALFDRKAQTVSVRKKEQARQLPLEAGLQDRLSFQLALRARIAEGASSLTLPVVVGKRRQFYHFEKLGVEEVTTSLGTFSAIHIVKTTEGKSNDKHTDFWLAPTLSYAVVKIEHWQHQALQGCAVIDQWISRQITKKTYA